MPPAHLWLRHCDVLWMQHDAQGCVHTPEHDCAALRQIASAGRCVWGHELLQDESRMSSSFSGLQLEQLKLLSTAERLGLFSLAERVLTTDPGAISSASIPFFLAAVGDKRVQMLAAPSMNPAIRYQLSRQLRLRQLALKSSMAHFRLQTPALTADIGISAQARWCSSPRTPCCSRSRTGRPSPHASRASPRCSLAALWWRRCKRSDGA